MALKIRLRRMGRRNAPTYRLVVAESSMPRDGRIVASIGHYNPRTDPLTLSVDRAKALHWIEKGAVPTDTAKALLKRAGVFRPLDESALAAAAESIAERARSAGRGAKQAVATATAAIADAATGAAAEVAERVGEVAEDLRENAADVIEDVAEAVAEAAGSARETAGEVVEEVRERVTDAIEAVTGREEEAEAAGEPEETKEL